MLLVVELMGTSCFMFLPPRLPCKDGLEPRAVSLSNPSSLKLPLPGYFIIATGKEMETETKALSSF